MNLLPLLASAFALLVAGCTLVQSTPDESRYYVLDDAKTAGPPPAPPMRRALAVARVRTPSYLDRSQIVSRTNDSGITFSELNRWLEPLDKGATRVFSNALASRLRPERIALEPDLDIYRDAALVQLDITRFDGELGGRITLEARWRISSVNDGETLATGEKSVTRDCASKDYRAYAEGMSGALQDLAAEIATSLRELPAAK